MVVGIIVEVTSGCPCVGKKRCCDKFCGLSAWQSQFVRWEYRVQCKEVYPASSSQSTVVKQTFSG